jgi:hypothetical protein
LVLAAGSVAVADSLVYVRSVHRVLDGRFSRVALNHRYGDVHAVGRPENSPLVVDAVVRVSAGTVEAAQAFADGVDFDVQTSRGAAVITTRYPRPAQPDPRLSYEVDIDLSLPGSSRLEVDNSFGDLRVANLTGRCELANRFGQVELERCGPCAVTGRYGDVMMSGTEGPLLVDNAFGNVVLEEIANQVQVVNQYGTVDADRVHGPARITNLLGNVRARRGEGRLIIQNYLGDVAATVEDPDLDDLQILSRLGQVELNLARGIPYRLGGHTLHGRITPLPPFVVQDLGTAESVSATAGAGGPVIRIEGVFSDFIIRGDSEPEEE